MYVIKLIRRCRCLGWVVHKLLGEESYSSLFVNRFHRGIEVAMSSPAIYCIAMFAVILTHSAIPSVDGQSTMEGCDSGERSMIIELEMQKLRDDLYDHVNKQIKQSHDDLLFASIQQMKSFQEHDIPINNQSRNGKVKN